MHANSTASQFAGQPPADLVLERLPSGELAWLRPETHPLRVVAPLPQPDSDARFPLTDLGRRALAAEALFGPWLNAAGRRTWTDPHQKPGSLCAAVWACGEPRHHHNCSDCEAHCRLGITAQDHERADPSDGWTATHCDCAYCVAHRAEGSAA